MKISSRAKLACWPLLFFGCSGQAVDLDRPSETNPADSDRNVLVSDTQISRIWVDGTRLFWEAVPAKWDGIGSGGPIFLRGCDVGACAATTTTYDETNTDLHGFSDLAVGRGRVSWANGGTIRTCAAGCDGAPEDLLVGAKRLQLAGDENNVCWSEMDAAYCCSTSGCNVIPDLLAVATTQTVLLSALAVANGYVYWTSRDQGHQDYEIHRNPIADLSTTSVVIKSAGQSGVVANSTNAYLVQYLENVGSTLCSLPECSDPSPLTPAPFDLLPGSTVQADDNDFYWLAPGGVLKRCSLSGCTQPETLLSGLVGIARFALGPDAIYWSEVSWKETPPFGRTIHRADK